MSSTNKTTNYELSQYIGSDKPTYLSDYNSDMYKIDAQMKINADNVATAIQGATDAGSLASTANSTATTANTNANTAIANNATTQATLNTFMQKFNLNTFLTYHTSDVTISGVSVANDFNVEIAIAKNSDGSIFKVYGIVNGGTYSTGEINIVLNNTGITVDSPYTIGPAGWASFNGSDTDMAIYVYVENNKMTVKWFNTSAVYVRSTLFPCVYFNADFGDTPQTNS